MKDPMRLVDRFCYNHPNFGIPNLMRYLTIANVVFWILGMSNTTLLGYLSFDAGLILRGQVWRLITFMAYPPTSGVLAFLVFYFITGWVPRLRVTGGRLILRSIC